MNNQTLKIGLIMLGGKNWIGGSEYIKNIILALSSLPDEVQKTFDILLLYSESSLDHDTRRQLETHLNISYNLDSELKPCNIFNRIKWKTRSIFFKESNPRMSDFLRKHQFSFIYPYLLSKREETSGMQGCTWIADFQHKYLPHFFTAAEIKIRDQHFEEIAKLASKVVLSSNSAAADFRKFFPNSKAKIEVLQFRTSLQADWYKEDPSAVQKKYNLPERFFLVSNQFWQHKNHGIIFKALEILKSKSIYPVVVFTGNIYDRRNPDYIDTILQTIHICGLASQTYLLGLIPKKDQMQLMRQCIAVIQPSLFEGWSTVVEDARCIGKKMILSDFSVHLEQNPPNSVFFERHSPQELADLICECWHSSSLAIDAQEEALVKAKNNQEIQEFGYRFLAIAKSDNLV